MIMACKDQEVQYQVCWQVEDLKMLIMVIMVIMVIMAIDKIKGIMQILTMP